MLRTAFIFVFLLIYFIGEIFMLTKLIFRKHSLSPKKVKREKKSKTWSSHPLVCNSANPGTANCFKSWFLTQPLNRHSFLDPDRRILRQLLISTLKRIYLCHPSVKWAFPWQGNKSCVWINEASKRDDYWLPSPPLHSLLLGIIYVRSQREGIGRE